MIGSTRNQTAITIIDQIKSIRVKEAAANNENKKLPDTVGKQIITEKLSVNKLFDT